MKKTDEQMWELINEQKTNAKQLAIEIEQLSGEDELDTVLILDALACAGLRIVSIEPGENVPSLAMFSMLKESASKG